MARKEIQLIIKMNHLAGWKKKRLAWVKITSE